MEADLTPVGKKETCPYVNNHKKKVEILRLTVKSFDFFVYMHFSGTASLNKVTTSDGCSILMMSDTIVLYFYCAVAELHQLKLPYCCFTC